MSMNIARKAKGLLLDQSCKDCRFYRKTTKDGIVQEKCGVMVELGGPWRPLPDEFWCEDYNPSIQKLKDELVRNFGA